MRKLFIQQQMRDQAWWFHPMHTELRRAGVPGVDYQIVPGTQLIGRVISRLGIQRNFMYGPTAFIALCDHCGTSRWFPVALWREPIPYILDCWEPRWDSWERILRQHRVRVAFFSARRNAQEFAMRITGLRTFWLPEAIDVDSYLVGGPLPVRETDVLEFGRPFPKFTSAVSEGLRADGSCHVHSIGSAGHLGSRLDFVSALANAKTIVCYPRI